MRLYHPYKKIYDCVVLIWAYKSICNNRQIYSFVVSNGGIFTKWNETHSVVKLINPRCDLFSFTKNATLRAICRQFFSRIFFLDLTWAHLFNLIRTCASTYPPPLLSFNVKRYCFNVFEDFWKCISFVHSRSVANFYEILTRGGGQKNWILDWSRRDSQ